MTSQERLVRLRREHARRKRALQKAQRDMHVATERFLAEVDAATDDAEARLTDASIAAALGISRQSINDMRGWRDRRAEAAG